MKNINRDYSNDLDVLRIHYDEKCVRAASAPHDSLLIFEYNSDKLIVGLELQEAQNISFSYWKLHPDRGLIPKDLFDSVEIWLSNRVYPKKFDARNRLYELREAPMMYAITRDSFAAQVYMCLEILGVDYDLIKAHNRQVIGTVYDSGVDVLSAKMNCDDEWAHWVVDEAEKLIK